MTLLVQHPGGYEEERRYAFDVVLGEFLGLAYVERPEARRDVEISLADGTSPARLVLPDRLFTTETGQWLSRESLPVEPLHRWRDPGIDATLLSSELPVLYGGGPDFEQRGDRIRLGLDVFGSVFFLVTRYEELVGDERDQHERYPARASVATREAFVERPLANELAEVLWACMRRLWPGVKRRRRQFALRLSHDVDFPLIAPVRAEAVERARRDLKVEKAPWVALRRLAARQFPRSTSPGRDLYNTFDALMRLSEGLGLQGAFYFIAGNTGGAIDGDYTLEDPWIQSLLRAIHDRGHEIGLHPSYGTFRDAEQTFREFDRLRRVCQALGIEQERWGGRQHYLRWENPTTWQNWENAGLDYDSTVGFAEQPGFRCGTCYEYPVFNLRTRQQLALRERPLIVMDASLFSYAGLTPRQAAEQVERLKARCRLFDGELTVLVHNDRFLSRRVRSAFRSVLA